MSQGPIAGGEAKSSRQLLLRVLLERCLYLPCSNVSNPKVSPKAGRCTIAIKFPDMEHIIYALTMLFL